MDIIAYTMAKRNEKIIAGFKENFMAPAEEFAGNGKEVSFTKSFDKDTLVVMLNGKVVDSKDYTADAKTGKITFKTAPASGAVVSVRSDYQEKLISEDKFGTIDDFTAAFAG